MKKRIAALVAILALTTASTGCYTLTHTVGRGAQGDVETSKRQWYAVFGLIPLGEIDSEDLVGGSEDYTVVTQQKFTDILLNLLTIWVTITSRTVTVTE